MEFKIQRSDGTYLYLPETVKFDKWKKLIRSKIQEISKGNDGECFEIDVYNDYCTNVSFAFKRTIPQ